MMLRGKVAVVTGGSQGIGSAIVQRFAREGAKLAVVASSDRAKAQKVVDGLPPGSAATAFACDVTRPAEIEALVKAVSAALGPIDILVNSAGVFYPTPLGATAEADFDRMVDINLKGTFFAIGAVVPGMKDRKSGKIVNLASVAGVMAIGGYGAYCATKAGIVHLTKSAALELAPHGINVNAIAPGNTATPMNEDIRTKPELKPVYEFMKSRTPSGRTYSSAEEMAGVALFLASDLGRAMHGSTVLIDEGIAAGLFA